MHTDEYRARLWAAAGLAAALATGVAHPAAAQPAVGALFTAVIVDGSPINWSYPGSNVSVEFDGSAFHMWYRTTIGTIDGMRHARSNDGVHFTSTGSLSFATNPFPTGTPPFLYYENTALVDGSWKLLHWTYNGGDGSYPAYNYNVSVSDVGSNPSTLTVTHEGPVSGGTIGQTAGSYGIVGGSWFGQCGSKGQDLCRAGYADGTPPSVSTSIYPAVWLGQSFFTSIGITNGYLNNYGKVVAGPAGPEMFFTVRQDQGGARYNQQVYWSGSTDGGASWSAPVALLTSPTLDGGPFAANFAHPCAVYAANQLLLYFSSQRADGSWVTAVSPPAGFAANRIPGLSSLGVALLAALLAAAGAPLVALRTRPDA